MPYSDDRRMTFAAIMKLPSKPFIWMELDAEGKPRPTRRKTGLNRYVILSNRQHLATPDPLSKWTNARQKTELFPTGLHVYTVRNVDTGEVLQTPAFGNGSTVWIIDPAPGKNDPPEPEPEPELTPEQRETALRNKVIELSEKVVDLQTEVDRLKVKYETPCPGLAKNTNNNVIKCGGFLGHPGNCAEVW